jgi:O-phosphoseryl-tRNA(Cys) synthetase
MKCHSFYTFYYPPLKARVEHIASIYETCQNVQNYLMLGFGELPPRNALLLQCSEVTVDFIGPWKITVTAQAIEFHAPT